jgi:hypothetical protein
MQSVTLNICHQCGKVYKPQRASSKFDTTRCRVAFNRDMKGRALVITQNKEDEFEMLRMFSDTSRRRIRKFTDTDTKFLIEFKYWKEIMGYNLKQNGSTPHIIKDVKELRNKLFKLGFGGVTINDSTVNEALKGTLFANFERLE